jgi:aminomethyltransferase
MAKKTPFYDKHVELKGRIVDFSGWLLPVQYKGIIEEVHATRKTASIFDVSHMGEFLLEGKGATAYLQKVLVNDISGITENKIMYSPVCYEHGGTVDDILVYCYSSEKYLLVVNAGNLDKDWDWFNQHSGSDVTLQNLSEETAEIALQGPKSQEILQSLTDEPLAMMKYYHFKPVVNISGVDCIVSRTGYTGEDGFEIYCSREKAGEVWDQVWLAGQKSGLAPAGLGARDVLRLEASLPLYGHELSETITPLNAGLGRFVSLTKETPFIGQDALRKQKEAGLETILCGLEMTGRGIAREGYTVTDGIVGIGWVSSGSYSPTLEKSIANAFIHPEKVVLGSVVYVVVRGKEHAAKIIKIPFYRREK